MATYDFSNLDFDTLMASIIAFIKESEEFKDYEFEGSALNSLARLLTYITLQQNYYLNMTTQELYLKSATIYKNAVAIANSLNYIPHRKQSAEITTTFAVDQYGVPLNFDLPSPILIPANCNFLVGGVKFITETSYNIYDTSPIEIKLYQRTINTETWTFDALPKELLYGSDIDEGYMVLTVDGVLWSQYANDIDATSDSLIYFVDNNLNEKLEISFGDNIIGKKPTLGDEIIVTYGITSGNEGNSLTGIVLDQLIYSGPYGYDNNDVTISQVYSSSGTDEESLQSIKVNAPKFYEAQNRAITKQDYETLLQGISFIETLNIWDGAELTPPTYGTVFSTFKPTSGADILTTIQKQAISDYIKPYMPLTLLFVIKDPLFIYLDIVSTIYYFEEYQVDPTVIRADLEGEINEFFTEDLVLAETVLRYSNLLEKIDSVIEVSNNLTQITCFIKFDKANAASNAYNFELGNQIQIGSVDNTYLKDDSIGNLILKTDDSIIGSIDYATGDIAFIYENMDANDNKIYFSTELSDIYFYKNKLPVLNTTSFTFSGV